MAPHHCSWHSSSYDSWSEKGENAKVPGPARNALGQALDGALIVAGGKPIKDDKNDPVETDRSPARSNCHHCTPRGFIGWP
jgi:hypothetical protein